MRAGRYEIREKLGEGCMGVVYLASDPVVSREVTVKTIRDSQDALARDLGDPMSKVEIKTMFAWAFTQDAVLKEVQARGVKDLEISEPSANELRAAGAAEDSLSGWLRVDTKLPQNSQNEFAFVHTGLFVKAAKGDMART